MAGQPERVQSPARKKFGNLVWLRGRAASIPAEIALQAATYNAARLLRAEDRMGLIEKGRVANLLLVDGNPLKDIKQTESIQKVIFEGERIDRAGLFE